MAEPKFVAEGDAVHSQTLQRPINAFGVTLNVLHFREPRAGDITRYGKPLNHTPGFGFETITFDEPKMTAMLAGLSGVPQSSIDTMTAQDWTEAAWGISRFFIPGMSTTRDAQRSNSQSISAEMSSDTSTDQMSIS